MKRVITYPCLAALLVAALAGPTHGQPCVLDPDGNGQTTVSELILAVNQALGGCDTSPQPTPTAVPVAGCPFDFADAVGAAQACIYRGLATTDCAAGGTVAVAGTWYAAPGTPGNQQILATLTDPTGVLGIFATRTGPSNATIVEIAAGPTFVQRVAASGTLALTSPTEFTAHIHSIAQDCNLNFTGTYATRGGK